MNCMECEAPGTRRGYPDPRHPPLDVKNCLCSDCYLAALEDVHHDAEERAEYLQREIDRVSADKIADNVKHMSGDDIVNQISDLATTLQLRLFSEVRRADICYRALEKIVEYCDDPMAKGIAKEAIDLCDRS